MFLKYHWPKVLFWLLCFCSIGALLTHLPGSISMHRWGACIYPAVVAVMVALWLMAKKRGDAEFLLRLRAGFVGGLLGTIGYDLVRVPFYYGGMNLMHAIRAYGMWLCGAEQSSVFTDLAGLAYHLSNGVTFGWIFSIPFLRRHWSWGLVWGLMLEALAMMTTFGSVFGMNTFTPAVITAFAAHVFYGVPLGLICQNPGKHDPTFFPWWRRGPALAATALFAAYCFWMITVQYAGWGERPRQKVELSERGLLPVWSNYAAGTVVEIQNGTDQTIEFLVRLPARPGGPFEKRSLAPGTATPLSLDSPGLYQIQAVNTLWRSVTVAAHHDGDYRPERW